MGGDKKQKQAREEAERQEQQARAEGERVEARAGEISALTPAELASIERGFGLEESLAGLALDPQRQVAFGRAGTEGLVDLLTQQALGQVETQFQRRGLGTSGLAIEGGTRAATEQALGVAQLVLQQAQQRSQFLQGVTSDITGRGQVARQRQVGGELGGLQMGTQATQAGFQRGAEFQQFALQQPSTAQQWGQGIGQAATTGAMLALMPATGGASAFLAPSILAGQSPLQQAGGPLTYEGFRRTPIPRR